MVIVVKQRLATATDVDRIKNFLKKNDLPDLGIEGFVQNFVLAEDEKEALVGVAGLELYGESGLLRSVAVDKQFRGHGLGGKLVQAILRNAKVRGVKRLYLLTDGAGKYFERLGFQAINRNDTDEAVRASQEFTEICQTCTAMRMRLS